MKSSLGEVGWLALPPVKVAKEFEGYLFALPFLNGAFGCKALLLRFSGWFPLGCGVFFWLLKLEEAPVRLQLPKQL